MTAEEIRHALARSQDLPEGRAKAQFLESLAEQARQLAAPGLEADVLIALSHAYEYASEREKLPVTFGRLLQLLDEFPAEVGQHSHNIYWMLKWMTDGLHDNPMVPLAVARRWLDEFDNRYRQRGFGSRPVLARRSRLARHLGDDAAASELMEASIAAPRDEMADCVACEHSDWGTWREVVGDDKGALEYWAQLLGGSMHCLEEPHRALAKALLPLLRTGRVAEARGVFLRGYPMVARNVSLMPYVGNHVEFCALTGNEARGLEILAEHADWLPQGQVDADTRLSFLIGAVRLLRRLAALGHRDLPVAASTVGDLLPPLEAEVADITGRYDDRNGNTAVSTRVARRLAQQPLLDLLPLGYSVRLPEAVATRHDAAHHDAAHYDTAYHDAAQGDPAPAALADPAGPGGEALIAQARRLTEARHPQAGKAWARVTATGQDLPAGVAAEAARARAGELMRADPRAAAAVLLEAAEGFAALGDLDHELEARASVAIAVQLAGDRQQAAEGYATVATQAQAAYADGKLTPRYYLNVTMVGQLLAVQAREAAPERDPADIAAVAAGLEDVRALAERLSQRYHVGRCHELLAQVRAWQGDADGMAAQLHAAREAFLAEDQPWFAAYPEATLAEHAIHQGNAFAAEKLARDALAHGAGELEAGPRAQLSSLLVVAIGGQQGRDADLADAALTAAGRWEGISEPDTLHNTFIAARAYAQMDRHGEAAALFAQAIPKVDIPYEPAVIAMTRDQYGRSLRAIERHREAAEQFLEAARLVQGDPDNAGPHAMLAALAAEELRASGQEDAALPAFMRAADLLGEAGDVVGRARCLRSAAWLQFDEEEEPAPGTDRSGVPLMRSVLADLEAVIGQHDGQHSDAGIAEEIDHTRRQLAAMLSAPEDDPEDGDPEDDAAG